MRVSPASAFSSCSLTASFRPAPDTVHIGGVYRADEADYFSPGQKFCSAPVHPAEYDAAALTQQEQIETGKPAEPLVESDELRLTLDGEGRKVRVSPLAV